MYSGHRYNGCIQYVRVLSCQIFRRTIKILSVKSSVVRSTELVHACLVPSCTRWLGHTFASIQANVVLSCLSAAIKASNMGSEGQQSVNHVPQKYISCHLQIMVTFSKLRILATPVTLCKGWQSGSIQHTFRVNWEAFTKTLICSVQQLLLLLFLVLLCCSRRSCEEFPVFMLAAEHSGKSLLTLYPQHIFCTAELECMHNLMWHQHLYLVALRHGLVCHFVCRASQQNSG